MEFVPEVASDDNEIHDRYSLIQLYIDRFIMFCYPDTVQAEMMLMMIWFVSYLLQIVQVYNLQEEEEVNVHCCYRV